jgi:hypothetical protein
MNSILGELRSNGSAVVTLLVLVVGMLVPLLFGRFAQRVLHRGPHSRDVERRNLTEAMYFARKRYAKKKYGNNGTKYENLAKNDI